eukprot:GEMP01021160.1.p1 GENE.GEMP01021160.1~~GEMP01021160.1.p1  ORF type:complete len:325 (+),score=43.79 GEMP01021160.1:292-1266(+)
MAQFDVLEYEKWHRMMDRGVENYIRDHQDTFLRRVRRGVPQEYRWEVWKAAADLDSRIIPGAFDRYSVMENQWTHLISMDVPRTFPGYDGFTPERQDELRQILNAYANLNSEVGYCQGMNFVAGLFLMVPGASADEAFWMFVWMMEYNGLNGFFKDRFPLLCHYLRALDVLVEQSIPALRSHLKKEHVEPAVYLHQWFLSLFVTCLPVPTVFVLWDAIICDGLPMILPITVALLNVLKNVLLTMGFEDIVRFFKTMKTGDEGCDATHIGQLLVKRSYRMDITRPMIDELLSRQFNDEEEQDWMQKLQTNISNLFGFATTEEQAV